MGRNYQSSSVNNCANLTNEILKTYASRLGDKFTNDVKDEEGKWRFNDGFPILKWQLEAE